MSTTLRDERWLVRSEPCEHPTLRLYCFHHAGGTAAEFTRWSRYLPDTVDVCAVQLPGRGGRIAERPHTRMHPLVEELVGQLHVDVPFVFFGHSFGALVAFELALALRTAGSALPRHLFLSARPAPGLVVDAGSLHDLPDDEFVDVVHRRHGGVPAELRENAELRAVVLPYFRADYEVTETYQSTEHEPLAVPVTVLGGTDDEIGIEALEAWQEHVSGQFALRMFPGDHFYLRPHRTAVLDLVRAVVG